MMQLTNAESENVTLSNSDTTHLKLGLDDLVVLEETLSTATLSEVVQVALAMLNHHCLEGSSDTMPDTRVQIRADEPLSSVLAVGIKNHGLSQGVENRKLLGTESNDRERVAVGTSDGTADTVLAGDVDGETKSGDGQVGEGE